MPFACDAARGAGCATSVEEPEIRVAAAVHSLDREDSMTLRDGKSSFNVNTAALVVWGMFAAVVCYSTSVWVSVAAIEHYDAFAAFSSSVYWLAAVLAVIIGGVVGLVLSRRGVAAGRSGLVSHSALRSR
jgi:fatty acid desaturase